MNEGKKKRGRPRKIKVSEITGMSYEGSINLALDKEVQSDLKKILADKDDSELSDEERNYLETQQSNRTRTLNIRFTESELQDIECKCRQFGYKSKSTYVRDCVKARVDLSVDRAAFAETNRQIRAIGNNINQIAVRLHSLGNIYAEDVIELKRGVDEIWQLLLSMQLKQQSGQQSAISQTEIRPSTVYMSSLMVAGRTAQAQARTSELSANAEPDGQKSSHTT